MKSGFQNGFEKEMYVSEVLGSEFEREMYASEVLGSEFEKEMYASEVSARANTPY